MSASVSERESIHTALPSHSFAHASSPPQAALGGSAHWGFKLTARPVEISSLTQHIESAHPYPNSSNFYSPVNVPGAVGYSVIFDSRSCTESDCDYVTFYKDESHSSHWGDRKYSGGHNGSTSNFPGVGRHPPLIIAAPQFVLHFHSDGSVNDWGYRITVEPLESLDSNSAVNGSPPGARKLRSLILLHRAMQALSPENNPHSHSASVCATEEFSVGEAALVQGEQRLSSLDAELIEFIGLAIEHMDSVTARNNIERLQWSHIVRVATSVKSGRSTASGVGNITTTSVSSHDEHERRESRREPTAFTTRSMGGAVATIGRQARVRGEANADATTAALEASPPAISHMQELPGLHGGIPGETAAMAARTMSRRIGSERDVEFSRRWPALWRIIRGDCPQSDEKEEAAVGELCGNADFSCFNVEDVASERTDVMTAGSLELRGVPEETDGPLYPHSSAPISPPPPLPPQPSLPAIAVRSLPTQNIDLAGMLGSLSEFELIMFSEIVAATCCDPLIVIQVFNDCDRDPALALMTLLEESDTLGSIARQDSDRERNNILSDASVDNSSATADDVAQPLLPTPLMKIGGGVEPSPVLSSQKASSWLVSSLTNSHFLRTRFNAIKQMNTSFLECKDFIDWKLTDRPYSLATQLSTLRRYLLPSVTRNFIATALSSSQVDGRQSFELVLSRSRATKHAAAGECDGDGRWSVFGQAFRSIHGRPPAGLRGTGQLWHVIFSGEQAHDSGGPYRESWTVMCEELMSPILPLLRPCPNARGGVGDHQGCWLLNSEAASNDQLQMFEFLGKYCICAPQKL